MGSQPGQVPAQDTDVIDRRNNDRSAAGPQGDVKEIGDFLQHYLVLIVKAYEMTFVAAAGRQRCNLQTRLHKNSVGPAALPSIPADIRSTSLAPNSGAHG